LVVIHYVILGQKVHPKYDFSHLKFNAIFFFNTIFLKWSEWCSHNKNETYYQIIVSYDHVPMMIKMVITYE